MEPYQCLASAIILAMGILVLLLNRKVNDLEDRVYTLEGRLRGK